MYLYHYLQVEKPELEQRTYLEAGFDEIACFHLSVIYYIKKKQFENAFDNQLQVSLNLILENCHFNGEANDSLSNAYQVITFDFC